VTHGVGAAAMQAGPDIGCAPGVRRAAGRSFAQLCTWAALAFALTLTAPIPGSAASLEGRVVSIADGDTITVGGRSRQETVRLLYIDAPERDQPWGREARRALQELVRLERVRIQTRGRDRYARTLGHVRRVSDGLDVNLELVRRGHAWASARGAMRPRYEEAQRQARAARRGLWQDPDPISPQTWRRRRQ